MWIVSLFAHLFANTGFNSILRFSATDKKADPVLLAIIMQSSIAIPAVVCIFFIRVDWQSINTATLPYFAAAISLAASVMVINAKALEHTEASVFAFLYNLRIGFATLFGIAFLGEALVPLRIVGGICIFAAGMIIAGKATARPLGVVLSVACSIVMTVLNAVEKHLISEVGYATYMFPVVLLTCAILWIFFLSSKHKLDLSYIKSRECGWLMITRAVSAYGFTLALAFGALLSVAVYVSSLSIVTMPIAAVIFLKETSQLKRKVIAGAVALIGVTLIFLA